MRQTPLADRMRPISINDIIGQEHIFGPGKLLRRMVEADQLSSIILYGPPGTGKTSIASVIANHTHAAFCPINATVAGKADMKKVVEEAINRQNQNQGTILFIDEIHRFNKAQQDYLLPYVEQGVITLIGATTENPYFEVNGALLSRSSIFELKPLSKENIMEVISRAISDPVRGLGQQNIQMDADAMDYLASVSDGDTRRALNALDLAATTTPPDASGIIHITTDIIMECSQTRIMRFDKGGDNHYDFISAYIESMRHSDVDASMYYLSRMLAAGEDPKYIARRLVIFAGEDNGLADPNAQNITVSAFLAVERIGMPEGEFPLALATVYCATAPKSHTVKGALRASQELVRQTGNVPIPAFLQDESYKSAHKLGRGNVTDVYQTPYNYDGLDCMPKDLRNRRFFHLESLFGYENTVKSWEDWRAAVRAQNPPPTLEND